MLMIYILMNYMAGALVRGFEPRYGLQVAKNFCFSFPLTRNDSILWGIFVTGRQRARPQTAKARILNPVSVLLAQFNLYVPITPLISFFLLR